VQAYKQLEAGDATIASLKHALGREVTETAVLRGITELWQQLRIIPVISAPGQAAKMAAPAPTLSKGHCWRSLDVAGDGNLSAGFNLSTGRDRASMEEVELFLAPLTARSKVREVLRGLVANAAKSIRFQWAMHSTSTWRERCPPSLWLLRSTLALQCQAPRISCIRGDHEEDLAHYEAPKVQPAAHTPAPETHRTVG